MSVTVASHLETSHPMLPLSPLCGGLAAWQLFGSAALPLGSSTAWQLYGLAALPFGSSTAWQLCGLAALPFGSSTAWQLCGLVAPLSALGGWAAPLIGVLASSTALQLGKLESSTASFGSLAA
jgi:hypothetical protein